MQPLLFGPSALSTPSLSSSQPFIPYNSLNRVCLSSLTPWFNCTSTCKRAFRIIHGYDVRSCPNCNMLDIEDRRKKLSLKLFKTALFSDNHVLHDILPPFSCRSNRLVLPFVRTSRRINSFVCNCAMMYNTHCVKVWLTSCIAFLLIYLIGPPPISNWGSVFFCFSINAYYYYTSWSTPALPGR